MFLDNHGKYSKPLLLPYHRIPLMILFSSKREKLNQNNDTGINVSFLQVAEAKRGSNIIDLAILPSKINTALFLYL